MLIRYEKEMNIGVWDGNGVGGRFVGEGRGWGKELRQRRMTGRGEGESNGMERET